MPWSGHLSLFWECFRAGCRAQLGAAIGWLAFRVLGRLRKVGLRNLGLAFPEKTLGEREAILRQVYRNLGWLLAEFCQMPGYTPGAGEPVHSV